MLSYNATTYCFTVILESVMTYMVEQYRQDTEGYNVSGCVHVEACWPGAPEGETKQVIHSNTVTLTGALGGWRA